MSAGDATLSAGRKKWRNIGLAESRLIGAPQKPLDPQSLRNGSPHGTRLARGAGARAKVGGAADGGAPESF